MGATLPIDNNVEAVVRFPMDRGIAGHVAKTGIFCKRVYGTLKRVCGTLKMVMW